MNRGLFSLLILSTLLLSACVGKNTYQQKVNEAELLSRDVATLTADREQLRQEKKELQDERSKLNARLVEVLQQNSKLQRDLLAAQANQERQEGNLSRHQQQLVDMQQTNDQLLATIEELNLQLEKEQIAREARLAKVKNTYDQLVGALEEEIQRGEITISNLEGKLSVSMLNKVLFDSGSSVVKAEGRKLLTSLGNVINQAPDKALRIEGHTDNVQISERLRSTYPSNWELSTARATNIVHYLQDQAEVPGERLAACGYSEYQPVTGNDTPEGKAQNRRTEIALVPYESGVGFKSE